VGGLRCVRHTGRGGFSGCLGFGAEASPSCSQRTSPTFPDEDRRQVEARLIKGQGIVYDSPGSRRATPTLLESIAPSSSQPTGGNATNRRVRLRLSTVVRGEQFYTDFPSSLSVASMIEPLPQSDGAIQANS